MTTYREAVVTFADILGFRDLVASVDAADLAAILNKFDAHSAPLFRSEWENIAFTAFSDLVVRVSFLDDPLNDVELADRLTTEASDLAAAQAQLCQRGIVIRGAITVGAMVAEPHLLFGPGLVRAYELESTVAQFPRVILEPGLVARLGLAPWIDDPLADGNDFEPHVMELGQYCIRDADGQVFVDYLGAMCRLGRDGTPEEFAEERLLYQKHASLVVKGLKAARPRVKAKYEWLRNYHNRCVADSGLDVGLISDAA